MSRAWIPAALCLLLGRAGSGAEPAGEARALKEAEGLERALVKTVEAVRPSSVTVFNLIRQGQATVTASSGSGVVIRASGLVLTNEHVVQGAARLEVGLLDGRRLAATVESHVPDYDIAVLQVRDDKGKPVEGLKPAIFGSSAALRPGQWVFATGNPFFLAESGRAVVTLGVVSGLDRVTGGDFFYGKSIQHDAEINPGNSGGPLWNLEGQLLGINGRIATRGAGAGPSSSGVGFTIPLEQIRNFLPELLGSKAARIEPGDLGVTVETAKDETGREIGARVASVRQGSAAAKAGAQAGDVIAGLTVKFHTYPIRNATEFYNALALWPEGTRVDSLELRRQGSWKTLPNLELGPPVKKAPTGHP